jgi:hypothetical protein
MTTVNIIPLLSTNQRLSITLSGVLYNLNVYWCRPAQAWILDMADVSGVPILSGVALVTGSDLLAQYSYLGIPGQLLVQSSETTLAMPTFTNLGQQSNLYYRTG